MRTTALFASPALFFACFAHAGETGAPAAAPASEATSSSVHQKGDAQQDGDATTAQAAASDGSDAKVDDVSTAEEPAAGAAAAPAERAPGVPARPRRGATAGPQLEGARDGVPDCRANAAVCWKSDQFAIWPRLRLRNGYEYMQPDGQLLTVGQNDGFFLDQNRIGIDGAWRDDVRFRLIVEVASTLPGGAPQEPAPLLGAAVRDAWVAWLPSEWFYVSAGQQFMPTDVEGNSTIANLPFARRSVATSGVRAGLGFAVPGLSPPRQLGIVLGSTENARFGDVVVEYQFAASNGNGQNVGGNDNKLPAGYGRVGVGYAGGDLDIRVGLGGRINPRTTGTLPNLFTETDAVGFGDLQVRAMGIVVVAQGIYRQTAFDTLLPGGGPTDTGLGGTAWLQLDNPFGLDLHGIKPAYRISYYDVSSAFPDDQLLENTLGLRWDAPIDGLPLALFVDGTLLTELGEGVRDLDNARVTGLVQFDF
jgi:hypothetical protein